MSPKSAKEQLGVDLPPDPEPEQINPEPEPEAEDERPDWLLEKFESVEDQARSYAEAERNRIEAAQARNALEERLGAVESELNQYRQLNEINEQAWYDPADEEQRLAQLFEEDPVRATDAMFDRKLRELQQQAAMANNQRAPIAEAQERTSAEVMGRLVSQEMGQKYPDWEEHRPKAQEILQERAAYIPAEHFQDITAFSRQVDEAYRLAKFEALEQGQAAAGPDQTEVDRQMKLAAQTMPGRSARPEEPSPIEQLNAELEAAHMGTQRYASWATRNLG